MKAIPHIIYTIFLFSLVLTGVSVSAADKTELHHGIAMHGTPKYAPGFTHFDYVNPDAPKGGEVRLGAHGTFDSLNPFIPKGNAAEGIGLIYDKLTVHSADEPFSEYGLIAEKIELPADRSWIRYHLNPAARFHDGQPITADDVVFSFNILMEKGSPMLSSYWAGIESVKALTKSSVQFDFKAGVNRELALIIGQLSVLPKHIWENRDFSKADLQIPVGSGPYRIKSIDPGRSIRYERVDDYWAKDLAVNKGRYNYDILHYDYYRDAVVMLEALKAGQIDYRYENSSKQWATGYASKALDEGSLHQNEIPHQNSAGMQGFAMNLRRDLFKDIRVRKALALAFDFEWANKNLFYNAYARSKSYFDNSELASSELPQGRELEILQPFKQQLPASVFNEVFTLPATDASGHNRQYLRQAKKILNEAGWQVKNNQLTNSNSGLVFSFEILLVSPAFERIVNPYVKNLQKLGIDVTVRVVDVSQYINRRRRFDFDMLVHSMGQSQSPGNEQHDYWHSSVADVEASRNIMGVKDPVVDELVKMVIEAPSREELVYRTRALDRVLLNKHLVVPHWHTTKHRAAYWDKFGQPEIAPIYDAVHSAGFFTWWIDPVKAQSINTYRSATTR